MCRQKVNWHTSVIAKSGQRVAHIAHPIHLCSGSQNSITFAPKLLVFSLTFIKFFGHSFMHK